MSRSRPIYYSVHPRYTPGSPAQVSEATAHGVVADELKGYRAAQAGAYGKADAEKAATLGLAGIVEELTECAEGWIVLDMLTDEKFFRPTARPTGKQTTRLAMKYGLPVRERTE